MRTQHASRRVDPILVHHRGWHETQRPACCCCCAGARGRRTGGRRHCGRTQPDSIELALCASAPCGIYLPRGVSPHCVRASVRLARRFCDAVTWHAMRMSSCSSITRSIARTRYSWAVRSAFIRSSLRLRDRIRGRSSACCKLIAPSSPSLWRRARTNLASMAVMTPSATPWRSA